MSQTFTLDDVQGTLKRRDAWWTVLLVDPLASRLVVVTANRTSLTPNQLTFIGLGFGLCAAALFWVGAAWALILGAVLFHISFVVDCMDGKIARLKGNGSVIGGWLDYIFDRIRVLFCSIGLFGGLAYHTGNPWWIWLAFVVVFVDMLRYMDAMQISLVREKMHASVTAACEEAGTDPLSYLGKYAPEEENETVDRRGPMAERTPEQEADAQAKLVASVAMQQTFQGRYSWYLSARDWLRGRRIRPHLFSGIEFQMFIFIVGPIAAAILGSWAIAVVTIASAVGLLLFEAVLVYKLVLSTRDMAALVAKLQANKSPQVVDQPS
ncbi:MAG: CDP-alcohol phosphatidyltransferase family protein [Candidatus Nanopelagicales bacterium]